MSGASGPPLALVADHANVYGAIVDHWHDGDTVLLLAWDPLIQVRMLIAVRLRGIQAPELADPGGPQVRAAVEQLAPVGASVLVGQVGPYPRPGHITGTLTVAGLDVGGWLLERGYAVRWNGRGTRPTVPWPPADGTP